MRTYIDIHAHGYLEDQYHYPQIIVHGMCGQIQAGCVEQNEKEDHSLHRHHRTSKSEIQGKRESACKDQLKP